MPYSRHLDPAETRALPLARPETAPAGDSAAGPVPLPFPTNDPVPGVDASSHRATAASLPELLILQTSLFGPLAAPYPHISITSYPHDVLIMKQAASRKDPLVSTHRVRVTPPAKLLSLLAFITS
jgi:hypothetical protein